MSDSVDDIVKEFLVESLENMDQLDRDLVALEKEPSSREILARVFRTIHTIKGTCGFLAFSHLEAVAHAGEGLLSRLRDGDLLLTPQITSALLAMVDAIRAMLGLIEATSSDGDNDYPELLATLAEVQRTAPDAARSTIPPHRAPLLSMPPPPATPPPKRPAVPERPERPERPAPAAAAGPLGGAADAAPTSVAPRQPPVVHEATEARGSISESTIRVDVGLLDKLMNLVGELVLARNQILQFTATQKDSGFVATTQRLNLITTELQEGVMKTRMQPIGTIWAKFPRVVRDLALTCGKQIQIEMTGTETELDKTIIEAIKDPLTHLIRNAVDHGIEAPPRRVAAGKPAMGHILLRAFHEGGQVNIAISDDGAGIDLERVRDKAVQRGLISRDQVSRLSDRDAMGLIFLPGFSTAERVTSISGRGVGMDVVKTNIEKIGGSVDAVSRLGQGSTFKIKIPLTLAIIPALIVACAGDRYAIPQVSLLELVRLEGERARRGIERVHGAPVYRLRGNLLPLLDLNRELQVEPRGGGPGLSGAGPDPDGEPVLNIVVLQAGQRHFGLLVESIHDTEEIVVKPLSQQLKGLPCFAGATIMGDGKVALILDVVGIAQRAGVLAEGQADRDGRDGRPGAAGPHRDGDAASARQTLLLFQLHGPEVAAARGGRMAIPLSLVARLEEFPRSALERAGDIDVVQYRDQILPLVHLSQALPPAQPWAAEPSASAAEDDKLQVVVYSDGRRSAGLVVDRIVDIVEETVQVRLPSSRPGILSSAVIQGRVTDMVDVEGLIRAALPTFFTQGDRPRPEA